jgi:hypothetical protein
MRSWNGGMAELRTPRKLKPDQNAYGKRAMPGNTGVPLAAIGVKNLRTFFFFPPESLEPAARSLPALHAAQTRRSLPVQSMPR